MAWVFDFTLPLEQVSKGYKSMDERRAVEALLRRESAMMRVRIERGIFRGDREIA